MFPADQQSNTRRVTSNVLSHFVILLVYRIFYQIVIPRVVTVLGAFYSTGSVLFCSCAVLSVLQAGCLLRRAELLLFLLLLVCALLAIPLDAKRICCVGFYWCVLALATAFTTKLICCGIACCKCYAPMTSLLCGCTAVCVVLISCQLMLYCVPAICVCAAKMMCS